MVRGKPCREKKVHLDRISALTESGELSPRPDYDVPELVIEEDDESEGEDEELAAVNKGAEATPHVEYWSATPVGEADNASASSSLGSAQQPTSIIQRLARVSYITLFCIVSSLFYDS
jgi:hypothetical protein